MTKGNRRKKLDNGISKTINDMSKGVMKVKDISEILRMPRSTVSYVTRCQKAEKLWKRRGRKPWLCACTSRRLCRSISENHFKHLSVIMVEFNSNSDVKLTKRTVRRYIHKMKINSYGSMRKPFLICWDHVSCLQWAIKHQDWSTARWSKVMLTGESNFAVMPTKINAAFGTSNQLYTIWETWNQRSNLAIS